MDTVKIGNRTYTVTKRTNRDDLRQETPRTWANMVANHVAAYLVVKNGNNGQEHLAMLFENGKAKLI